MPTFWDAVAALPAASLVFLLVALAVAFAFEFINGFHDTANAVTTVIYTRTLNPTPAVIYSGFLNFLGVLLGGTLVAFSIVNLLPVDLLVDARSGAALVMVLSILVAGVAWNLGTWYLGLPVSSSHTLIGSILGVGIANSLISARNLSGVRWDKVGEVGLALLVSPLVGFALAALLLLCMKRVLKEPRLYVPPQGDDRPPGWIRGVLIATCGGVSFAHGSNDGQKGMGLLLLVLIGFLPAHYALTVEKPEVAPLVFAAAGDVREAYSRAGVPVPEPVAKDLDYIARELDGKASFAELADEKDARWEMRQAIFRTTRELRQAEADAALPGELKAALKDVRVKKLTPAIEFVPLWVVVGTALALGVGTTIGYKRIVVTVAEKIGKTHLTYAQGAAAETVAAGTILVAAATGLPVSTTQVLSSGVAGTMMANQSGVQSATVKKIGLAWVLTLPACVLLSALLFAVGRLLVG
jgi:phosphate/sulfate permease